MNRRTFLKAVFAAAVAPTGTLQNLYRPVKKPVVHTQYMYAQNDVCSRLVYYEGPEPLRAGTLVCYSDAPNKVVKPLNYIEALQRGQKFAGVIATLGCNRWKNANQPNFNHPKGGINVPRK